MQNSDKVNQGRIKISVHEDTLQGLWEILSYARGELQLKQPLLKCNAPIAGLVLLIESVLVSVLFMRGNVKEEPLKLLGGKRQ